MNGIDILRQCRALTSARIYSNTGSPEHSAKMSLLGADQALHKNSTLIHRALGLDEKNCFHARRSHTEQAIEKMARQGRIPEMKS